MKINTIKNTSISLLAALSLTACSNVVSSVDANDMANPNVINNKEMAIAVKNQYNNIDNLNLAPYTKQVIKLNDNDGLDLLPDASISLNLKGANIHEVLEELSNITNITIINDFKLSKNAFKKESDRKSNLIDEQELTVSKEIMSPIKLPNGVPMLPPTPIMNQNMPNNSNQSIGNDSININFKNMSLSKILESLEDTQNIDFTYDAKSNILYVKDYITIQGNFNILDENVKAYDSIKTKLESILSSNSKKIVIDTLTGAFFITSEPNDIKDSKDLIENILNSTSSFAYLELKVYKINNSKLKEFGINADVLVKDIYSLSTGAGIASTSPIFSAGYTNKVNSGNVDLTFGLKMLEQKDIINNVSARNANIFNGLESTINNTKDTGYWVPGETKQSNQIVSGVSETVYTEGKPTFEKETVGDITKIGKPKINMIEKNLYADLAWEESSVYDYTSTIWNRTKDSSVTLTKPLIVKADLKTRMVLEDNKYVIMGGSKSMTSTITNKDVPGFSMTPLNIIGADSENNSIKDIMIIAKANFPKEIKTAYITKVVPFAIDNQIIKDNNRKSINLPN